MKQVIALMAIVSVAGSAGYFKGRVDEFKVQNERRIQISEQLFEAEAQRLKAERDLEILRESLDEQAVKDPDAGRVSFGTDSVRRLNQIR